MQRLELTQADSATSTTVNLDASAAPTSFLSLVGGPTKTEDKPCLPVIVASFVDGAVVLEHRGSG